jgi:LysR family transcriptional regulator, low CO2-responsive transcriptional regulator
VDELQLPHLETFCKAAELSSFTAAAQALRLTQAAVSQRIAALEKALGKPVFQRQRGRVALSPAGRTVYDYAQRILDLHREVRSQISGSEAPVTGELLLAASSVPGEHLLPALLADFRVAYPQIKVRATIGDSQTVLEQVERGTAHLGLVGQKTAHAQLEYRFLARDRMVLVAAPSHPLCKRRKLALTDLRAHPILLREAGSGSRHCLEKSLDKAGLTLADLSVALELGSNEAIKEGVLRGLGTAVLSAYAVQKELATGKLRQVNVVGLECERDMYVIHDRRRALPAPARQFLIFLEAHPLPKMH